MLSFDTTTLAAYRAAPTPQGKAQAVSDSLGSGTLTVELRDGATLMYSGSFAGPLVVGADGSVSKDVVPTGLALVAGTANAATWTCRIRNAAGTRTMEGPIGAGSGHFTLAAPLEVGQGVRLRINITAAVGLPPLAPEVGAALLVASANDHQVGNRPSGFTASEWTYSVFGSYGSGTFNPHYSANGAYVIAGTGGHGHPDTLGALVFDWGPRGWVYLPAANSGAIEESVSPHSFGSGEVGAAPWREILIASEVPAPPHPYKNQHVIAPDNGGGAKGSMVYVNRSAVAGPAYSSPVAHAFDLDTRLWARKSTNESTFQPSITEEQTVVHDPVTNRYYILPDEIHVLDRLHYLDGADWTYKQTAETFAYPTQPASSYYGHGFYYTGGGKRMLVYARGWGLRGLDLDNIAGGFVTLLTSGTPPASQSECVSAFAFHQAQGVLYHRARDAGQTLTRLTPGANPMVDAWTYSTVTLTGDTIPAYAGGVNTTGDQNSYRALHYIPALRMLGWVSANGVALLNP